MSVASVAKWSRVIVELAEQGITTSTVSVVGGMFTGITLQKELVATEQGRARRAKAR